MDILQMIRQSLSEKFGVAPEAIVPEATLESLNIDSLSLIELMFALEDELHVRMPEGRVELKTIGDVVDLVRSILAQKPAAAAA